jgi:hypothetical protein
MFSGHDASGGRLPHSRRARARFVSGVACIAASFLIYPAYTVILLLPFPGESKVVATLGASILSWAVFGGGIVLAGQDGLRWLKERWKR